ncbi:MAG: DUF2283 domain-containing protein [bacterium]
MLKLSYDREEDVLEIRFSENPIEDSEYIEESALVVDYDKSNKIVAIEIISFSKKVHKEELAEVVAI